MGYLSRKPTPNEPPRPFPYGADEFFDDFALLIGGLGKRCAGCLRVTRTRYLNAEGKCPWCAVEVR